MLIHQFDNTTGGYLNSCLADADPRSDGRWLIPAFSTSAPLPERTPLSWPFFRDGAWLLLPDYRGRPFYRQDTGEPTEILTAGKTPAELNLTDKPRPSERHTWINGEWTVSAEQLAQERRDAMMAEFDLRMSNARAKNAGKADALAAGLLTDEETYYFKAWSAYQMALVRVIESETFPDSVEWPDTPAVYVPPPPPQPEAPTTDTPADEAPGQEQPPA